MAITSTGIGSGLDVESIVSQLVAAERSPTATRLSRNEAVTNYTLSALGSLKSAMSSFRDAANKLFGDDTSLKAFKATSGNTDLLGVSASEEAAAGDYTVTVEALAKSHKMVSGQYTDPDALVGAGDFTFTVNGSSFTVTMNADSTLNDLRNAINDSAENVGVSASLITEDGGTRMVLTSSETGVTNQISITSTTAASFTELRAAADAKITVEGYSYTSASNSIDDAISGVTLKLLDAEPGTEINVNVAADNSKAQSAILGFVSAYNSLVNVFVTNTKYDAEAQTAGALNGDASTRTAQQQLRQLMTSSFDAGSFDALSDLGISMATTGGLTVDSEKLSDALADDFASVEKLFSDPDKGLALRADAMLDPYLEDTSGGEGILDTRIDSLNNKIKGYDLEWSRLDDRMARVEEQYRRQFNSLDAIVNQYNGIASFLAQNFATKSSS